MSDSHLGTPRYSSAGIGILSCSLTKLFNKKPGNSDMEEVCSEVISDKIDSMGEKVYSIAE